MNQEEIEKLATSLRDAVVTTTDDRRVLVTETAYQVVAQSMYATKWARLNYKQRTHANDVMLETITNKLEFDSQRTTVNQWVLPNHERMSRRKVYVWLDPHHMQTKMKSAEFASGKQVKCPLLVVDEPKGTLVAIEMIDNQATVKASWAALVTNSCRYYSCSEGAFEINGAEAKEYVTLKSVLPSKHANYMMLHKQATPKTTSSEYSFIYVSVCNSSSPAHFASQLSTATKLPMLTSWSDDLWKLAKQNQVVERVGAHQAYWYRVNTQEEEWSQILKTAISNGELNFKGE